VDNTIIIAAIGLIGSALAGLLSYRASATANRATADANRINEKKVDAEAYARSQGFYEKLLVEADRHLDRLRKQVEELSEQLNRVTDQLNREQRMSDNLRNQVREMQQKMSALESTLTAMRVDLTNVEGPGSHRNPPPTAHPPEGSPFLD
jgi:septal ring factor EnvC (AmiA/AmiB activator)